jgi:hypothetical protein
MHLPRRGYLSVEKKLCDPICAEGATLDRSVQTTRVAPSGHIFILNVECYRHVAPSGHIFILMLNATDM